jgi:hypothetical protein
MYLFGVLFIRNFVLVFILTLLLLSIDFYYLKNIAGRRLVGLRWWNEVNTSTGDSHWVFESAPEETRNDNKTDKRFFWLSMYIAPALWVGLAILAIVRLQNLIWLVTIGESCSCVSLFSVFSLPGKTRECCWKGEGNVVPC